MSNTDNRRVLATMLWFVCSVLLVFGFSGSAAAISFTAISGPGGTCTDSSATFSASGFCNDQGIDFSELTGNLVTSVHFDTNGLPHNLDDVRITDGFRRVTAPAFINHPDELKVATARTINNPAVIPPAPQCPQNVPVGTIFTSTGIAGQVAMVDPATGNAQVITLPGEQAKLRGGFFFDRFCVIPPGSPAGNHLIVVSGDDDPASANAGGKVWVVSIPLVLGVPTMITPAAPLAQLFKPAASVNAGKPAHLEGVILVPNDVAKYGDPALGGWAGMIVTGDEDRINSVSGTTVINGLHPRIYAINPITGASKTFGASGESVDFTISGPMPHPEDFDFVEDDFYGIAANDNQFPGSGVGAILKAPGSAFNATGDILITQEYPQATGDTTPINVTICNATNDAGTHSGLYQILWNGTQFVSTELSRSPSTPLLCQWEHVTLVPVKISITKSPKNATFTIGQQLTFTMVVTSNGPGTARNVTLQDPLPTTGGLTWTVTSVTPTGFALPPNSCSIASQTLSCAFGDMAPTNFVTIVVTTNNVGGAPAAACTGQKLNNIASATARGLPHVQDSGDYTCTPPQLKVVKTPDNGTFTQGSQVSFTIVVSNPAPTGASSATNVVLADTLPTNGGLTWDKVTTTQGLCSLSGANNSILSCTLGTIAAQGSVTVTVTSTPTTPDAACTIQPNNTLLPALGRTGAVATAAGNLIDSDVGSLVCTPIVEARITGGGSIFATVNGTPNVRVTHGLELRCDATDTRQSLEINWDGGNNFHLDKLINSVTCFDDPTTQPPPPPNTVVDTYAGTTLFNGKTGYHGFGYAVGTGTCNKEPATIYFILIDAGEPGTADIAEYHIVSTGCTLDAGPALLDKGNHQFHKN